MTGCSSSPDKYFENASSDIRSTWDEATRLDKADDYLNAARVYDSLLYKKLTSKQEKAVQSSVMKLYQRLRDAASKGAPDAQRLLDSIEAKKSASR